MSDGKLRCPRCGSDKILPGGSQSIFCVQCREQIPFKEMIATVQIPDFVKMTCEHVLSRGAKPAYDKEDDCYTCQACRDPSQARSYS